MKPDEYQESDHGVQRVLPARYEPLMSAYLKDRRQIEHWHLNWVEWDGRQLRASARLEGWRASSTDGHRFHLSIFSAREMDAQLAIIGMHLKLGLSRKTAEVWLLKCTEDCRAAITDPDDVRFEMRFELRRSGSGKILSQRECVISDKSGGQILISGLGLLPWNADGGDLP